MVKPRGTSRNSLLAIILATFALSASTANSALQQKTAATVSEPLVISKQSSPLSFKDRSYLANQNTEKALVWVFFTDKGVFTKEQFNSKASGITFSEKVTLRRAKMGLTGATFVDLPVLSDYLKQLAETGAVIRRASRWLNAASIEIDLNQIDQISDLSFVASVKPIYAYTTAPYTEEPPPPSKADKSTAPKSGALPALDYGNSQNQLDQINVPGAHALGFDGTGATLAILDTGYRKSHEAFAQHYLDGRVMAEYDFINDDDNTANEAINGDWTSQWNHGTYIWSVCGGNSDGNIYGSAPNANFLLAKTEDVRTERPIEEDNWVAALEWADSLGADVITTSLGYLSWDFGYGAPYTYSDMDGATATTSIAASTAASRGIVLCNSMGNSGPSTGTLTSPADAFDILAVGAVGSTGIIASFSSRGLTYDGRIKPEVVARGISTFAASATNDASYALVSGTSLSTPLVGGAAAVMVQARPDLNALEIREALMGTADRADNPDSTTYGYGLINLLSAIGWGSDFSADVTTGPAPMIVQFTNESDIVADSWVWDFGDGDSAFTENAGHTYTIAGVYPVSLTQISGTDSVTQHKLNYIFALGDTVIFETDSAYAGHTLEVSVNMSNSQPVQRVIIPFKFGPSPPVRLDSVTRGVRTDYFEAFLKIAGSIEAGDVTYLMQADNGFGAPSLPAGTGEIMKIFCTIDSTTLGELNNSLDTTVGAYSLQMTTDFMIYNPESIAATISTRYVKRGDANNTGTVNVSDLTYLVAYLFGIPTGPKPFTIQGGDVNKSGLVNISDVTYIVDYLFGIPPGPAPPSP